MNPDFAGSDYEFLPVQPVARYVVEMTPVSQPVSNGLLHALRIHRLLVLYYARPLVERDGESLQLPFGFDWCGCSAADVRGEPDERVRDHRDRLEAYVGMVEQALPTSVSPESDEQARRCIGWELHLLAEECLEASGRRIKAYLRPLLQVALPESAESLLARIDRLADTPHGGPFCVQGEGNLAWDYPHRVLQAINEMGVVEERERQLVAAGWQPAEVTVPRDAPDNGNWSMPKNRTDLIRFCYPDRQHTAHARNFLRLIQQVFVHRQCSADSDMWQVKLTRSGQPQPLVSHSTM